MCHETGWLEIWGLVSFELQNKRFLLPKVQGCQMTNFKSNTQQSFSKSNTTTLFKTSICLNELICWTVGNPKSGITKRRWCFVASSKNQSRVLVESGVARSLFISPIYIHSMMQPLTHIQNQGGPNWTNIKSKLALLNPISG